MKKYILLGVPLLLLSNQSMCSTAGQTSHDLKNYIVTSDYKPTENLKKLFELCNVPHDGTLEDMAKKAQELWDSPGYDFSALENKKAELRPLFESLGMINTIDGMSKEKYTYAIVATGWVPVTFCRLAFLKKTWEQGVRFEKIIILTTQGDLVAQDWESNRYVTIDKTLPCKTEHELILALYNQVNFPEDMQKIPVVFTNVPKEKMCNGRWHAGDEITYWFTTNPEPGDCLVVINQPYVRALEDVVRNVLPDTFKDIDAIGYAISPQYETVQRWCGALSWLLESEVARLKKS